MKYSELRSQMEQFNEKHGIKRKVDTKYTPEGKVIHMKGRVIISQNACNQDVQWTKEQRTYEFTNYEKALTSDDLGYSIFAHNPYDNDCWRIEYLTDKNIEEAEIVEVLE